MSSVDLSLVCVYNNEEQYERMVNTLNKQHLNIEIIGFDNRGNEWSSAAAAYNEGVRRASSPLILFSHQDILFMGTDFLDAFVERVRDNPLEIVGVAGAITNEDGQGRRMLSGMYQGSLLWRHHTARSAVSVETLDECLFGCNRAVFDCISFDEDVCNGWHFYAVDLCLQARLNNIAVTVLPADVIHESGGNRDASYYLAQERIKKKYADSFAVISTTCGWTRTLGIDPYRPIIDDELSSLRASQIPYTLIFSKPLYASLDFCNVQFIPSIENILHANHLVFSKVDRLLFDALPRLSKVERDVFSCAIQLNNFVASKRWLYSDLVDLKLEYPEAIYNEFVNSISFTVGRRFAFWDRTDERVRAFLFMRSDAPQNNALQKESDISVSEMVDNYMELTDQSLELALSRGEVYFSIFIRMIANQCLEDLSQVKTGTSAYIATLVMRMCYGEESILGLDTLCQVKAEHDRLENDAEYVRLAFERSTAFRAGRLISKMAKTVKKGLRI